MASRIKRLLSIRAVIKKCLGKCAPFTQCFSAKLNNDFDVRNAEAQAVGNRFWSGQIIMQMAMGQRFNRH